MKKSRNVFRLTIAVLLSIAVTFASPVFMLTEHAVFAEDVPATEESSGEVPTEELSPSEVPSDEAGALVGTIAEDGFTKYGNLGLTITQEEAKSAGFEPGDVVTVSFLDNELELPFVTNYSDVDSGSPALLALAGSEVLTVAINMGDFTTTYGIATKTTFEDKTFEWNYNEGVEPPVKFSIEMKEKGGYYDEYLIRQLSYTYVREDYPNLSDEQFANFRIVDTTGMGKHTLFRTASPIDNSRGRKSFADEAIKNAYVSVIINLSDDEGTISGFEGFDDTYYSTTNYIGLNMGVDFMADDFKAKFADGLRFMAENPGVYAIHCLEGKDRTGFVIAVLECLMGASYDEVISDYMVTFYNYYGVEPGDERYEAISKSNIVKSLQSAFGVSDLKSADLAYEAEEYLKEIGLSDDTISTVKENLVQDNHDLVLDEGKTATCTEAGLSDGIHCSICGEIIIEQVEIEPLGHVWGEWTVIKEATETEEGLKTRVCEKDPSHIEEEIIPKLEAEKPIDNKPSQESNEEKPATTSNTSNTSKTTGTASSTTNTSKSSATKTSTATNVPKTGDESEMVLWLMIFALGAAGTMSTAAINRKRD